MDAVDADLAGFARINPCGYQGLAVTQMVELATVGMADVEPVLVANLSEQLGLQPIWSDALPASLNPESVSV